MTTDYSLPFTSESLTLQHRGIPFVARSRMVKKDLENRMYEKQLSSDLLFLSTCYYSERMSGVKVIYVGTVGGRHLPVLSRLFPNTEFYVYGHPTLVATKKNLHYVATEFTDSEMWKWEKEVLMSPDPVIFISDVRKITTPGESEVRASMAAQMRWLQVIKPDVWTVSFRLPITQMKNGKSFLYLDGTLSHVAFSKSYSPELRLRGRREHLLQDSPLSLYLPSVIQDKIFYHNSVTRESQKSFANLVTGTSSPYSDKIFNNSYDHSYFIFAVMNYLSLLDSIEYIFPSNEENVLAFARTLFLIS